MKEVKFYICEHCGNIVTKIDDSGVPLVCCGSKMTELKAGSVDASREKHVPVVKAEEGRVTVTVGSVIHPMTEEHSIEWIYLLTDEGGQLKYLAPGNEPVVEFAVAGEKPLAVYAYCNLHGLWKSEI